MLRVSRHFTSAGLVLLALLSTGCGSLLGAARDGDLTAVRERLGKGENPNEKDDRGTTALCEAIRGGNVEVVSALLAAKANPNMECNHYIEDPNERGTFFVEDWNPLELAATQGNATMVAVLLAKGADPFNGNRNLSVLARMATYGKGSYDRAHVTDTLLDFIAKNHGAQKMKEVANELRGGWKPIAAAAWMGDGHTVKQLLAHGVDPNDRAPSSNAEPNTDDEWPILFFTMGSSSFVKVRGNKGEVGDILLAAGAKGDVKSRDGMTLRDVGQAIVEGREQRRQEASRAAAQEAREARQRSQAGQAQWNSMQSTFSRGSSGSGASAPMTSTPSKSSGGSSSTSGKSSGSSGCTTTNMNCAIILKEDPPPPPTPAPPPPAATNTAPVPVAPPFKPSTSGCTDPNGCRGVVKQ